MIKVTCDRCKEEIDSSDKVGYIAWNIKENVFGDLCGDNIYEASHFCMECMESIRDFIQTADKQAPKKASDSKEEEKKGHKEQKKDRKAIDHGKIRALKDAGWSVKEIAEEMKMTTTAVSNSLYNHKDLANKLPTGSDEDVQD